MPRILAEEILARDLHLGKVVARCQDGVTHSTDELSDFILFHDIAVEAEPRFPLDMLLPFADTGLPPMTSRVQREPASSVFGVSELDQVRAVDEIVFGVSPREPIERRQRTKHR